MLPEKSMWRFAAGLAAGGTSLDAVTAAVKILEDSPHFNAGKGPVFTSEGRYRGHAKGAEKAQVRRFREGP